MINRSYMLYTTAYTLLGYIITYEQLFIYGFLKNFLVFAFYTENLSANLSFSKQKSLFIV